MSGALRRDEPRAAQEASGVMRAVEAARSSRGLTKAELARRSGIPPETVRRLLSTGSANPTLETVLGLLRPLGLGLGLAELPNPVEEAPADPELVRVWLAHLGAPLYGTSSMKRESVPRPEHVLAEALQLAREDATVARALPVAVWRTREAVDMAELRRMAAQRGQVRTLGFFLELTSELSGDTSLAREAHKVRPRSKPRRAVQFFRVRSRLERRLAEAKTPDVARRWNFRMNMSLDSFTSMFRKAKDPRL
jgi:transcriptional regulator with XRE-family HTH domain